MKYIFDNFEPDKKDQDGYRRHRRLRLLLRRRGAHFGFDSGGLRVPIGGER